MKIGYPCINRTVQCSGNKTFRLRSYSRERLIRAIGNNLDCLERVLRFNIEHGILFFRITSDLVPFASHPVCKVNWQGIFKERFRQLGDLIKAHGLRISMHPDQFIVLNSPDEGVLRRSIAELEYQACVLDLMGLDGSAKIQLHVGGVYGDKAGAMARFIRRWRGLSRSLRRRLVIENDEKNYGIDDCLFISRKTGAPVLFDAFHYRLYGGLGDLALVMADIQKTWGAKDGLPMVDYSSQKKGARPGAHAQSIDRKDFLRFLEATRPFDFDMMLEIKDKERSALMALKLIHKNRCPGQPMQV
ncbi:MAG TPA: UV DNA damage repair endonuclease UvsE [Patescibacteria group bacterium]|nr:UV DNA damage repair endonuclease UvsE [Patescibacteria group bacterium]